MGVDIREILLHHSMVSGCHSDDGDGAGIVHGRGHSWVEDVLEVLRAEGQDELVSGDELVVGTEDADIGQQVGAALEQSTEQ